MSQIDLVGLQCLYMTSPEFQGLTCEQRTLEDLHMYQVYFEEMTYKAWAIED